MARRTSQAGKATVRGAWRPTLPAALALLSATILAGCAGDADPSTAPRPATGGVTVDPVLRNGQISSAVRYLGAEASGYQWRAFDPVSETGLFASGSDRHRVHTLEGLEVVRPTGPVATLTCARELPCSPEDTYLSYVATLGPGPDELTLESGDSAAQVIGFDGAPRGAVDLGATVTGDAQLAGLRWSADGRRLAVITIERVGDTEVTRVWLTNGAGGDAQLAYTASMSHHDEPVAPPRQGPSHVDAVGGIWLPGWSWSWSPDGQTLLLDVRTPGSYGADVVALHVQSDGGTDPVIPRTLFHSDRNFDWWGNLAWAPDGSRIAVRTEDHIIEISAEDGSVVAEHPHDPGWLIWPAKEG